MRLNAKRLPWDSASTRLVIEVIFIMTIVCNNIVVRVVYVATGSQVADGRDVSWIKAGAG
jgi:hypothetical protein